jgi:hypothetical protein
MKTENLRSKLLSLTVLTALLLMTVPPVAANKPDREPLEPLTAFIIEDACSFDVRMDDLTNRGHITVFYDKDGNATRLNINGSLKVRLTNLDTLKWMDANVSGPGQAALLEDGTEKWHSAGNWLLYLTPSEVPDFQPRVFLYSGRIAFDYGPQGFESITVIGGRMVDVCAALG